MRATPWFVAVALMATACSNAKQNAGEVALVDRRSEEAGVEKQVVTDEAFAALQDEVTALKDELAALKAAMSGKADVYDIAAHATRLAAAEADIASHESELTALNTTVNAIASKDYVQQRWLYDANKVKRHKVVTVYDRDAWQEAVVEIVSGVNARYILGRHATASAQQAPQDLVYDPSTSVFTIRFEGADCTGKAVIYDSVAGSDYGQAGSFGDYVAWTTAAAERLANFTTLSISNGAGCINNTQTLATWGSAATLVSKSAYSYPNPLTVGP